MDTQIPSGPWGNPTLEHGSYKALITNVRHIEYGEDKGSMIEITLSLEDSGLIFVSRLYLPEKFSAKCQHRFWHFSQSIGMEGYEVIEEPASAHGRKLILEIATVYPTTANHGHRYSDVKRFLPYGMCNQESEDAVKRTAV